VTAIISEEVVACKLIRTESNGSKVSAYYNISINEAFDLQQLISRLQNSDLEIDFNMVESGVNW